MHEYAFSKIIDIHEHQDGISRVGTIQRNHKEIKNETSANNIHQMDTDEKEQTGERI